MDIFTRKEMNIIKHGEFTWKTAKGEILLLSQMETKHIFNCAKLLFNHVAELYGGKEINRTRHIPVWSEKAQRDPIEFLQPFKVFYEEIERRGDLPDEYRVAWERIKAQFEKERLSERLLVDCKEMNIHRHFPEYGTPKEVVIAGYARCSCNAHIDICSCLHERAGAAYADDEIVPDENCQECFGSGFVIKKEGL